MLRPSLEGAFFLDLYAGSGAMGLEALSQGAAHATFIDSSKEAISCIEQNVQKLGVEKSVTVLYGDVLAQIKKLPRDSFDILYADPPYDQAVSHIALLEFLDLHPLVKKGGLVLLEEGYPSVISLPQLKNFFLKESRHFGNSLLHQYRRFSKTLPP